MNVVSYCLYGQDKAFQQGAMENLLLAKDFFPGWACRFYISQEVPNHFNNELTRAGAEVIPMTRTSEADGMFWRFLPIADPEVNVFISRDLDARLCQRDRYVVDEWLRSNKTVHTIRDHPGHLWEIQGGLWGYRGTNRLFAEKITEFLSSKADVRLYDDQIFLREYYYSLNLSDVFVHSDFIAYPGEEVHPILFPREGDGNTWLGLPHGRDDAFKLRMQLFLEKKNQPLMHLKVNPYFTPNGPFYSPAPSHARPLFGTDGMRVAAS
jgi:hypothetical protein